MQPKSVAEARTTIAPQFSWIAHANTSTPQASVHRLTVSASRCAEVKMLFGKRWSPSEDAFAADARAHGKRQGAPRALET